MTLAFYLSRRFLFSLAKVLAVVICLVLLVDGVEQMRIFNSKVSGFDEIVQLALLRVPVMVAQALPLIMMLASLSLFLGLSRSSELVISRAAGVSAIRLLMIPAGLALLLGALAVGVFNPIVATTAERYETLSDRYRGANANLLSLAKDGVWLRQGGEETQTVIKAARASSDGTTLWEVSFHVFDLDNSLEQRIEADRAVLKDGHWLLYSPKRWWFSDQEADGTDETTLLQVPTDVTSEEILDSFAPPQTISFWHLPRFIERLEASGFSATRHRLFLQSELAKPLLFGAMVLIGAGFSMRHVRFGQVGVMVLFAVLAAFALYFFKDVAETLGAAGKIPIPIAAWSTPIAALLLSLALLLHLEDG